MQTVPPRPQAIPSINFDAIRRSSKDSTIQSHSVDGNTHYKITEDYSLTDALGRIEFIAEELLKDDLPLFDVQVTAGKAGVYSTPLSTALIEVLKTDVTVIHERFPFYVYHPYIAVFMRLAQKYDLYHWASIYHSLSNNERVDVARRVNHMCEALRDECRSKAFKKSMKGHLALVRKNHKSLHRYIDALFVTYARLLVIRIDLDYLKGAQPARDWTQARQHRKQIIVFINKELPRLLQSEFAQAAGQGSIKVPGYVICAEYGADAGWHFHVTLLLNGNDSCRSVDIARLVGEHWNKQIAQGVGRYYNCNAHPSKYKSWGIGDVHWWDMEKREGLRVAIAYFGKADYYGNGLIQGNDRFLSRGGMPREKKKLGRPRSAPSRVGVPEAPDLQGTALRAALLLPRIWQTEVPF
ncbi:inovirus-type Gp2 protein [Variovorax sp. H27-G14]|uniref:hypothetical protein n=1 Tax=Variovorax sp. H27-G14 TaxID=3111914 RepID=UPI0038FD0CCF